MSARRIELVRAARVEVAPMRVTWVAGFRSESIPGQVWIVGRTDEGELVCTCRGFQRSCDRWCSHCEVVLAEERELPLVAALGSDGGGV